MSYPPLHAKSSVNLPGILTDDEFADLFAGESTYIEFKQGLPQDKIQETVAAFSNTDGGVLIAGIADDGSIHGLTVSGETEAKIHRLIAGVRDPGRYQLHQLVVGSKVLLAISVGRRMEGFAQLNSGAVPVRRGASNVKLFGEELATFLAERKLSRFETTITDHTLSDADVGLVESLREAFQWHGDIEDRLHEVGFVQTIGANTLLTVAGALFLLTDPAVSLGKCFIEYFRYPSNEATYDRRVEIAGPCHHQIEAATELLTEQLGYHVAVLGLIRHEIPKIPLEVLREAVSNAVAHRQYELNHTPIRISHYPDRVIVESPGLLPEPVTVEGIRSQSAARNPAVIRTLRMLRLAEDAGLGVDLMEDRMKAHLLMSPAFEERAQSFVVTLTTSSAVSLEERAWITEVVDQGRIDPDDLAVLVHAVRGERLTNKYVRDLFGMDSADARASLHRLRDAGLLNQQGERKGAAYVVSQQLVRPSQRRVSEEELMDLVLELAEEGPISNAVVRSHTGLDRPRATSLLRKLVQQDDLVQFGKKRGTRYALPGRDVQLQLTDD